MPKILITGGAGFIAFHLSQCMHRNGYEVVGLDNFNDYYDPKLKHARAKILKDDFGINVENVDLKSADDLTECLARNKPDLVVHLGAYAGVRHSLEHPEEYVTNNIVGTHNLIQAMKNAEVENVLYASTSCVMAGNPLPWNEHEKTGYQLNPYGYSKYTNESQFMASDFTNAIGLRFFTVYGPWGRPDMALFDFTNNIVKGNPIKLFNFGNMIRDFTYVDDIVQGIEILVNRCFNDAVPGEKEIYNIGNGRQVQLMDFVNEIEKNLEREAIKEFVPKHPADTQATWSDTTKLEQLGYKPTTPIEEGVAKFIEWYKSYYGVN